MERSFFFRVGQKSGSLRGHFQDVFDTEGGKQKGFDIEDYQRTATALTGAAVEIRQMLTEIRGLIDTGDTGKSADDSKEFDVREYGAAADSIQHSTSEIRALISDLRGITDDKALRERIGELRDEADGVAQRTEDRANGIVDHLAVRLIQVVPCGFFFLQFFKGFLLRVIVAWDIFFVQTVVAFYITIFHSKKIVVILLL